MGQVRVKPKAMFRSLTPVHDCLERLRLSMSAIGFSVGTSSSLVVVIGEAAVVEVRVWVVV